MRKPLIIYFKPGTDLGTIDAGSLFADLGCGECTGGGYDNRKKMAFWLTNPIGDNYNANGIPKHPEVFSIEPDSGWSPSTATKPR